ncbi:MAG: thiamine pyrophosphate-dependent enzyme [Planctomycetota bacterium]|nr:thiamine pyrophosphate-dependent enzyme [Planctomycetota bacterium]
MTLTHSGRIPVLKKKDFESDQEVRWCPGCGDYAILAAFLKTLPTLGIPRENHAIISGIGCAARFPYYVNTYGFHTIHGRAPTIASGLKSANPDLTVWIITGDGDALSIGGNHLLHCLRRNMNVNILLFNNRIYGLTKGQYSPTSEKGKVTKSTPLGSIESPVNPLRFAMASEATFVARTMDSDLRHMSDTIRRAQRHKGVSFVEIMQNCIIFNNGTWKPVSEKKTRAETTVTLEQNKPLIFGQKLDKGLRLKGLGAEVVEFDPETPPSDLLVHDVASPSSLHAYMLTEFDYPEMPIPIGVFRQVERPTYEDSLHEQNRIAIENKGKGDLKSLLHGTNTWEVNADGEEIRNDAVDV